MSEVVQAWGEMLRAMGRLETCHCLARDRHAWVQAGGAAKAGAPIKARVLDISKKDGVVDLSLKPALTAAGTKKAAEALASTEASPAAFSCASSMRVCMTSGRPQKEACACAS